MVELTEGIEIGNRIVAAPLDTEATAGVDETVTSTATTATAGVVRVALAVGEAEIATVTGDAIETATDYDPGIGRKTGHVIGDDLGGVDSTTYRPVLPATAIAAEAEVQAVTTQVHVPREGNKEIGEAATQAPASA